MDIKKLKRVDITYESESVILDRNEGKLILTRGEGGYYVCHDIFRIETLFNDLQEIEFEAPLQISESNEYAICLFYDNDSSVYFSGAFDSLELPFGWNVFCFLIYKFIQDTIHLDIFNPSHFNHISHDKTIYSLCLIKFTEGGKGYHYYLANQNIKVNDFVLAPIRNGEIKVVKIVNIESYTLETLPFDLDKLKIIHKTIDDHLDISLQLLLENPTSDVFFKEALIEVLLKMCLLGIEFYIIESESFENEVVRILEDTCHDYVELKDLENRYVVAFCDEEQVDKIFNEYDILSLKELFYYVVENNMEGLVINLLGFIPIKMIVSILNKGILS